MPSVANSHVRQWVEEMAALTKPDRIEWCDGSEGERARLTALAVSTGVLIELDPNKLPGCYLHRSHPKDVARVEHLTFICTPTQEEAGPTNNWMAPQQAYEKCRRIFDGAMKGRTMYVVPYLMGPPGSPFSKVGVQLTDSVYVVLNLRIMTRMGSLAWKDLGGSDRFVRGLHSVADLNPERRYICHFPQDYTIWSVGSGYGGNALLPKKCFALRLAGYMARQEGWLAEHMLIMGIEDPRGEITYIAAAFPSACGKTNLAMMVPPARYAGYKIHTVGDDIAWLRFGPDGRLWAQNPEAGFFGVAPGTNAKANPNAMKMVSRNTLFTNVVLTPARTVWWEGMEPPPPGPGYIDWTGKPWDPAGKTPGAHGNARFTVSIRQCPTYSAKWEDPQGVPISAILFGARRTTRVPLVMEAFDWAHGVYLGATLSSETTAAAEGAMGVVRRDSMAMLPFCGYNMADYFAHWLAMGRGREKAPRIYRVNWFRKDAAGRFLWPGYGENLRVLQWIVDRCRGRAPAVDTPIGRLPPAEAIERTGLAVGDDAMRELLAVDRESWREAARGQKEFFDKFGGRMPQEMEHQRQQLLERLRTP